jgi:hypothetical protein
VLPRAQQCAWIKVFYYTRLEVLSDVLQVLIFWPFIYDVFSDELCSSTNHSKHWLLVDIKIVGTVSSATDCTLLQPDIWFPLRLKCW